MLERILGGWKRVAVLSRSFGSISPQFVVWKKSQGDKAEVITCRLLSKHTFASSLFPLNAVLVDDTTRASAASRLIRRGQALIYEGDYHNARQLLSALKRRVVRNQEISKDTTTPISLQWQMQRQLNQERARKLNMLLVHVESDHRLSFCRRAPEVSEILYSNFGKQDHAYVIPLREVIGMIGAYEWKKKGVFISQLDQFIHPHYGVFVPTRREYLDLLLKPPLPLPKKRTMLDVGIGTGVITAMMLLKGKVDKVVGTDINPNAIFCARDNLSRLNLSKQVELFQADVFPSHEVKADLIVCNPPWLPGTADSLLDLAVYDEDLRMLRGFISQAKHHLRTDHSEVWLILSTMAELLGLRTRQDLLKMIEEGGLMVEDILETQPVHARARSAKQTDDFSAISAARASETTLLYRLKLLRTET